MAYLTQGLHKILWVLIALSMGLTFFGKAIIGVGLSVCVLISMALIGMQYGQNKHLLDHWKKFIISKEIILICGTFMIWFYSAYQGIDTQKSLMECLEYFGIIIGGVILFLGLSVENVPFRAFFKYVTIAAALCACLMILAPFMGDYRMEWSTSYASVLAVLFPFAFIRSIEGKRKPLWWCVCFCIVCGIFASGGRTAWVAFGLVIVLIPFLVSWKGTKRKVIKNYVLLALISLIGAWSGLNSYNFNAGEGEYVARTQAMVKMERPASGRLEVWANTVGHIENNFWWGTGIKTANKLGIEKSEGKYVAHVHNAILELLLETGIFGLMAISMTIGVFVAHFIGAYLKSHDYALKRQSMAVFLSCITYGVCSMALTSMFHAWWFLYLVALLVLLKIAEIQLIRTQAK